MVMECKLDDYYWYLNGDKSMEPLAQRLFAGGKNEYGGLVSTTGTVEFKEYLKKMAIEEGVTPSLLVKILLIESILSRESGQEWKLKKHGDKLRMVVPE